MHVLISPFEIGVGNGRKALLKLWLCHFLDVGSVPATPSLRFYITLV